MGWMRRVPTWLWLVIVGALGMGYATFCAWLTGGRGF